jgi:hypothetical protein
LVVLFLVPGAQPWAGALPLEDISAQRGTPRLQVAVHQRRLSVDLWEADLGEVLAQIHQQAGISVNVSPGPEHRVSVQFTDVALDQGLRRLLQLASRSYAMRYAPGPTGEVALREVQVFAAAPAGGQNPAGTAEAQVFAAAPAGGQNPAGTAYVGEKPGAEVAQRFVDAMRQRQAVAPAVAREDMSNVASRFRDALERNSAPAPELTDAPESDAAHPFRAALEDFTEAMPR